MTTLVNMGYDLHWLRLHKNQTSELRPLSSSIKTQAWLTKKDHLIFLDYVFLANKFRKMVREVKPDLIHAGPIQRVAFLPAYVGFHPLVSMSWGSDLLWDAKRNAYTHWVTRFTMRHTDVLIGDCQAVKRKAEQFGFPGERMVLFPWGIDLKQYYPGDKEKLKKELGWQDHFVFLSTRAWERIYGVDVILKAFQQAHQQMPEACLKLVGGGSQESAFREYVSSSQLGNKVEFLGRVPYDHLPRFYQAADVFISASHSDGSSVSLMESLACGCPALVSDIPSNQEWIRHNQQGWIFLDNQSDDLASKMIDAYTLRHDLQKYQRNARKIAEEKADWMRNSLGLPKAYSLARKLMSN